jgi:hypothetical protein
VTVIFVTLQLILATEPSGNEVFPNAGFRRTDDWRHVGLTLVRHPSLPVARITRLNTLARSSVMRSTGGPCCDHMRGSKLLLSQFSNLRPSFDAANESLHGFNWLHQNALYTGSELDCLLTVQNLTCR